MARTPSAMIELGTKISPFELPDASGEIFSYKKMEGKKAKLIMFICNHCPFVKHVGDELAKIGREYLPKGVGIVAINSNDYENYQEDSPEKMLEESRSRGYEFPYLVDESQTVAKRFGATCTPDFFLYDQEDKLVYRGQLDDSRPGNESPVDGKDLRLALDAALAGIAPLSSQIPSIGCNIKWKDP